MLHFYADFKYDIGFRCHPCEILHGPFYDDIAEEHYYTIKFVDVIQGTIDHDQEIVDVPTYHIFDTAIELVDLPEICYWGHEFEDL